MQCTDAQWDSATMKAINITGSLRHKINNMLLYNIPRKNGKKN